MPRSGQVQRSAASSANTPYCPDVGDIIRIDFDPQAGREQAGKRPAIVLSPRGYNQLSRLCVLCPITNQGKGYPFEVSVGDCSKVSGFVLSDQVKSLSWHDRDSEYVCDAPEAVLSHTKAKVKALLQMT